MDVLPGGGVSELISKRHDKVQESKQKCMRGMAQVRVREAARWCRLGRMLKTCDKSQEGSVRMEHRLGSVHEGMSQGECAGM